MALISPRVLYALTGTQDPAGMLLWAVDRGQKTVKKFIDRMVLRTRSTLGVEGSKTWSIYIPGKGTQTASMRNLRGDSPTDTAIKAVLWGMRERRAAQNELYRMASGLPHGLEGVSDQFGPTTEDQAMGFIYDRSMAGVGRPHGVDPVITPAVIVAIIGLVIAIGGPILKHLLSRNNDVMEDTPSIPVPQDHSSEEWVTDTEEEHPPPEKKMGGLDQKTILFGGAAVAALLLLRK